MKKALLIGINYIGTSNELRGCINDVVNMKNLLLSHYGFASSEIVMMTELSEDLTKIPTLGNIIQALTELVRGADSTSQLILHYSGHGGQTYDRSRDEVDRRDEMIYALDGQLIDDDLKRFVIAPLPEGAHLTFICDSCNSGTIGDIKYSYRSAISPTSVSYTTIKDTRYADSKANVVVWSGCRDDQTSADAFEAGINQGAMTYAFLETLKKFRNAQPPKAFSYASFLKSMCAFIKVRGYTQVPQMSSGKRIDISHTPFILV